MNFTHLFYFKTIAESESMTEAAKKLHVSQPALSKILKQLEDELTVSLFERKGRVLHLNSKGNYYLKIVNTIFKELEEGKKNLVEMALEEEKHLSFGTPSSRLLEPLFSDYVRESAEKRTFSIKHLSNQQAIKDKLLSQEIDFGLFYYPVHHPEIESQLLWTEEILLAVPPEHKLANRKSIKLTEVKDEPFVAISNDFSFGKITRDICLSAGFIPNIQFEMESFDFTIHLVNEGHGITLIPNTWKNLLTNTMPTFLKIEEPKCERMIWLLWHKKNNDPEKITEFYQYAKKNLNKD